MWMTVRRTCQTWRQRHQDRRLLRDRLAREQQRREAFERGEERRLLDQRLFRLLKSAA